MHTKKPLSKDFLSKFKQGARTFLENLTNHKEAMTETFAYSQKPISKSIMENLHPVKHVRELPDAIRKLKSQKVASNR